MVQANFVRVLTIDIRRENGSLTGSLHIAAISSDPFALDAPLLDPQLDGNRLVFKASLGAGVMALERVSEDEVILAPVVEPDQLDLTDPAVQKAIEAHRVRLTRTR